jgi:hypothetical protein
MRCSGWVKGGDNLLNRLTAWGMGHGAWGMGHGAWGMEGIKEIRNKIKCCNNLKIRS